MDSSTTVSLSLVCSLLVSILAALGMYYLMYVAEPVDSSNAGLHVIVYSECQFEGKPLGLSLSDNIVGATDFDILSLEVSDGCVVELFDDQGARIASYTEDQPCLESTRVKARSFTVSLLPITEIPVGPPTTTTSVPIIQEPFTPKISPLMQSVSRFSIGEPSI